MKNLFLLFCLFALQASAQKLIQPQPSAGEILPDWAKEMYSIHPNVWSVEDGYRKWRKEHPEEKTTYTQFYKKWSRAAQPYVNAQGFIEKPDAAMAEAKRIKRKALQSKNPNSANWKSIGPFETFNTNTGPAPLAKSEQANIYCIDQSLSNPDVIYCGTEGSEIFKSTDRGLNWTCVSRDYEIVSPTALEVDPGNPDLVFVGEGSHIRKSTDGGANWQIVLTVNDLSPNEILVNPADPMTVLAATFKGLYRSADGGQNWNQVFPEACYDIEWKSDDPNTVFLVRNDPQANICRFYKSEDMGQNWLLKSDGWFFSDQAGVYDGGARLAVSKADPKRIYAVLIGEAKTDDSGFIGIYRSNDGGETWTLPNPPAGGPWNDTDHPNMATIGRTGGYHQGFYNLGFDVSDSNPDQLMAGFLNLWISNDGGVSFDCIGGYCGNDFNYVHPDCQEIEINDNDVWMTSDGGIEYSNDAFQTHFARNRGITSSDFWGFGTGWNEDLFVGGRYHNGNTGWYEEWEPGECLGLGGGEASTGYVNPGSGRKTYFSDIGGVVLPEEQDGHADYFSVGKYPNESYYDAESGEMEWDPRCWNTFYVSSLNNFWKTEDGGSSWSMVHTFGTEVSAPALGFEISRSNPDVIYLFQRASYTWDPGKLWKSSDGGQNWSQLPLPPGYARRMLLTLSPENENLIWAAYPDGGNGEKIYKSEDGGQSWQNLSTDALDNEHISYILHQGGTDGGVYLGTYGGIWYKDDNLSDWTPYEEGLPKSVATCILRPFYRDGKLRIGAYSKGVWESPFAVPSRPVAQPMVNKRQTSCPGDTLRFDDFSMLAHEGASWNWSFPGGTPATSTLRSPKVVYQNPGEYDVTLSVSNPNGSSSKTVSKMVKVLDLIVNKLPVVNDFSGDLGNLSIVNPDNGVTWEPVNITGCNSEGDTAYFVHNYVYSAYGVDDILLPLNLDLTQIHNAKLTFRVAYAPYFDGNAFIDSLKVMLSSDCGNAFATIFRSGGEALSTTTSGLGANNLYEYEEFVPANCDEWREISLDLSAYAGKYISVKIVNQSGYGNNMYVDDLALTGDISSSSQEPKQAMRINLQPNPTAHTAKIQGTSAVAQALQLNLYNSIGVCIWAKTLSVAAGDWQEEVPMESFAAGVYRLQVSDARGNALGLKVVKVK